MNKFNVFIAILTLLAGYTTAFAQTSTGTTSSGSDGSGSTTTTQTVNRQSTLQTLINGASLFSYAFHEEKTGATGTAFATMGIFKGRSSMDLDEAPLSQIPNAYQAPWPIPVVTYPGMPGYRNDPTVHQLVEAIRQYQGRSLDEVFKDREVQATYEALRGTARAENSDNQMVKELLFILRDPHCSYRDFSRDKEVRSLISQICEDQEGDGTDKLFLVVDLDVTSSLLKIVNGVPDIYFEVKRGAKYVRARFDRRIGHRAIFDLGDQLPGLLPIMIECYYKAGRDYVKLFVWAINASDHQNSMGLGLQYPFIPYNGPLTVDGLRSWDKAVMKDTLANNGIPRFDLAVSDELFHAPQPKVVEETAPYDFMLDWSAEKSAVTAVRGECTLTITYADDPSNPVIRHLKPHDGINSTKAWTKTDKGFTVEMTWKDSSGREHRDLLYKGATNELSQAA